MPPLHLDPAGEQDIGGHHDLGDGNGPEHGRALQPNRRAEGAPVRRAGYCVPISPIDDTVLDMEAQHVAWQNEWANRRL